MSTFTEARFYFDKLVTSHSKHVTEGDCHRIVGLLQLMIDEDLPPQTVRSVYVEGVTGFESDTVPDHHYRSAAVVKIKVVEFCRPKRIYEKAYILLIPDAEPYLLCWTGPTEPPMSIFKEKR